MTDCLYHNIEKALLECDPDEKCRAVSWIEEGWKRNSFTRDASGSALAIDDPGRPARPILVDPRKLQRRTTASARGRILLLHAIAHIEFNAVNIALDAVYRFRNMPDQYVGDWIRIANEEVRHFRLLDDCLRQRGSYYGEYEAHSGLWDMVCKTRHDVMHRMALVPRVLEARGLDVTPGMIERFKQEDDRQVVDILSVIYAEEIGHVAIGSFWYQALCEERNLEPDSTFEELVDEYFTEGLRGPFNWPARLKAGFRKAEMQALESRR